MMQNLFLLAVVLAGAAAYMGSRVVNASVASGGDVPGSRDPVAGIAVIAILGLLVWSIGAFGWQWAVKGTIAAIAGGYVLGILVASKLATQVRWAPLAAYLLCGLGVIVGFSSVVKAMQGPEALPPCVQPAAVAAAPADAAAATPAEAPAAAPAATP
jgi:hypothetical protein